MLGFVVLFEGVMVHIANRNVERWRVLAARWEENAKVWKAMSEEWKTLAEDKYEAP